MERIKDIHKGKRIWVCGSGGSLLDVIPSKIPSEDIIIACNSATLQFDRIDYAVFTDGTANYAKWYTKLKEHPETTIILLSNEIAVISDKTIHLEKDFHKWKFNEDDTKIIGGYDVIHCATHIAWLMGASQIVLAGVDLKHYSKGRKHAHVQEFTEDMPEALRGLVNQNDAANDDLFDGYLGMSLAGWNLIYSHNQLNIVNISTDGNLKIYPTIKFTDLCK